MATLDWNGSEGSLPMSPTRGVGEPASGRSLVLGQPRGFCAGVSRAVATVREVIARYGPPVHVLHQIVHNDEVIEELRVLGAVFVESLSEIPAGALVILSPHGVPPSTWEDAGVLDLRVIDTTCPLVAKVHTEALRFTREGRCVLLIGYRDHAEVRGVVGEIPGNVTVVDPKTDIVQLELPKRPIAVLSQTTLPYDVTERIIAQLRQRHSDVAVPAKGDICFATQNRQEAVRVLAQRCGTIIVVSGAHSNNGSSLAIVAEHHGCRAYLTPNAENICPEWVTGDGDIGLVAAASTPEMSITGCIRRIQELDPGILLTEMDGITEQASFPLPAGIEDAGGTREHQ